jgi:hypothetical protein
MGAVGAQPAAVRHALARAVAEHAACARHDHMLIVTSEPYSDYVIAVMQEWAEADMRGSQLAPIFDGAPAISRRRS